MMKYFARNMGSNRMSMQTPDADADIDLTIHQMIDQIGLIKVNWLRFHLFRLGLINVEAEMEKIVCRNCGQNTIVIEQFFGGQSEGLPEECKECNNCMGIDREVDKSEKSS
jgi:hypothetical protein